MLKRLSTIHYPLSTIALAIALTACAPQAPQRPSQRSGQQTEPDSATLAMVELHQRLADAADVELNRYIRNHPGQWSAQDDGSWVMEIHNPQSTIHNPQSTIHHPQSTIHNPQSTELSLRLITRDLDGKLLSDVQGEYELGKCQLPSSVETVITTFNFKLSTFNFKVLAPWYVAYGSQGNDAIPGYQNVIIEVYIL